MAHVRSALSVLSVLFLCSVGCGGGTVTGDRDGGSGGDGGSNGGVDAPSACVNLECFQVACPGGGSTTVSGTVYAPNGTLPLYNVTVYVPNAPVEPFTDALTCDRCGSTLSGSPLVQTATDSAGRFSLANVPATDSVPLVIQVGKWRRQVIIPTVPACTDTPLAEAQTRLPRNRTEGDIPRIALTTGGADALECLLRKVGIDDAEIGTRGGAQRIHLYAGSGGSDALQAGGALAGAQELWGSVDSLSGYDVVILSCEGGQHKETKPATALQAMYDYTGLGGRVFASHWHNWWIQGGPDPFPQTVTFQFQPDLNDITADLDTGFDKGQALAEWLVNVGGSTSFGQIAITAAQHTVTAVNAALAQRWIHKDVTANGTPSVQYFSFTTPLTVTEDQRCGRVVFSDIHVSSGDRSDTDLPFPTGCTTTGLTPQEKVLAFMLFDIASCVGPIVN